MLPVKNNTVQQVCDMVESRIFTFMIRLPNVILTDNGQEFRSGRFDELLHKYRTSYVTTTADHPSSNGAIERVNRTMIVFFGGYAH